jgi:hypothetical protein
MAEPTGISTVENYRAQAERYVDRWPRSAFVLRKLVASIAGWRLVKIWEHESPDEAADTIEDALGQPASLGSPAS